MAAAAVSSCVWLAFSLSKAFINTSSKRHCRLAKSGLVKQGINTGKRVALCTSNTQLRRCRVIRLACQSPNGEAWSLPATGALLSLDDGSNPFSASGNLAQSFLVQ